MKLIDADDLRKSIEKDTCPVSISYFYRKMREAPTIDAVPVKHGRWIAHMIPSGVSAFGVDELTCEEEECSICGAAYWIGEEKNYCPNCGAKMDGERRDDG